MFKWLLITSSLLPTNISVPKVHDQVSIINIDKFDVGDNNSENTNLQTLIELLLSGRITMPQLLEIIKSLNLPPEQLRYLNNLINQLAQQSTLANSNNPITGTMPNPLTDPLSQALSLLENQTGLTDAQLKLLPEMIKKLNELTTNFKDQYKNNGNFDENDFNNIMNAHNAFMGVLGPNTKISDIANAFKNIDISAFNQEQLQALSSVLNYGWESGAEGLQQAIQSLGVELDGFSANFEEIFSNSIDYKGLAESLKHLNPEALKVLANSGFKNPQSIQDASKAAAALSKMPKFASSFIKVASNLDTITTVLMWCLAVILLLFGTIGLIASTATLRYKTLITHKKILKNPKFLFTTWILVILTGVGAALGAMYG